MKRKFKLPSNFLIENKNDYYVITIDNKNLFWVGASVVFILTGLITSYYISLYFLILCLIGGLKILFELTNKQIIEINFELLKIENQTIQFKRVKNLSLKSKRFYMRQHVDGLDYSNTCISINNINGNSFNCGKNLSTKNQNDLIMIINQFRKLDYGFIKKHLS